MDKNIKIKNILFYTFSILIVLIIIDVKFHPFEKINYTPIKKGIEIVRQTQTIAPARVYINVWRIAKSEYADKSMNNQDWKRWRNRYNNKIKTMEDCEVAVNTMLSSLNDPYTRFLKSTNYKRQKVIMESKITGVGLTLNKSSQGLIVNKVIKNSSAKEQNIMPGDCIIKIDNVNINMMTLEQIQNYINSGKDKVHKVEIKRGGLILVKELKSGDIPIDTMKYVITKDNIGIITLSTIMGEKALIDFKTILEKTNNTKGLIIDLRNNYGGILANAVQMADMMITDGLILSIEKRGVPIFKINADEKSVFTPKPVIILVNEKTASASEVLAGALKSDINAIIMGENTYGKNTIQQVIPMSNKTGMIITTEKYILPNGDDIEETGIVPDITINSVSDKKSKDKLLSEAVKLVNNIVKNDK